ncbi:adenosylcobinamide-phosphate synthase [Rhodobacter viridis]|uniref:Cobalamin biosynthesis protein CobD n=1 Tax=Rhodobacter viridis TaxID=1054202 RepID=A0A318U5G9_9RHOB|nr:adenosylcobinamide-phosphate synthase CbiB [Rhodobacter viridis]PYF07159.1 adenosylcobinamide-phosphate synthase [Rhodobacter viridis]
MNFAAMMAVAIAIDLALGWPDALYKRIGHPVTWIGALIARLEKGWNFKGRLRRLRGVLVALAVIGTTAVIAASVQTWLPAGWLGVLLGGVLAWPFVALRSMHDHVAAVAKPLLAGDLPGARHAVSMIVGRDPSRLDQPGVARAALESLAENSSDGIVAPLFWGCVAGLPGIAAYKAINTLDSMIGHRTERYEQFGWASARIDDLVNLIPARLTGLFFALASSRRGEALAVMLRDARSHRSPNAGWPESALAGGLGIRLSGPRIYADRVAAEPWLNGTAPDPTPDDLARGLALYRRAMAGMGLVIGLVALLWSFS